MLSETESSAAVRDFFIFRLSVELTQIADEVISISKR